MKINSILIGKGSGSAGNVTVTQLKGQTILKQKATIVANPNTAGQQKQRKMMNRAVYAWQMVGNTIKQGWTSIPQTWSQFNAFVSANSLHFVNKVFTPETFQFSDLLGAQATKGQMGVLQYQVDEINPGSFSIFLDNTQLNAIAKIGDKICASGGDGGSAEGFYDEITVDAALLAAANPSVQFEIGESGVVAPLIATVYLVTADGKKSTSSQFV